MTRSQIRWGLGEAGEGGQGAAFCHRGHVAAGRPRSGAADRPVGVGRRVVVGVKAAAAAAVVMTRRVTILAQSMFLHILFCILKML